MVNVTNDQSPGTVRLIDLHRAVNNMRELRCADRFSCAGSRREDGCGGSPESTPHRRRLGGSSREGCRWAGRHNSDSSRLGRPSAEAI